MKKMGRRHRPFFRICAMDSRTPRDGRPIEELGHYDPMIRDVDARAILNGERIDYWLSVGAKPSVNMKVLIRKYGANGTHLEKQKEALARIAAAKRQPMQPLVAEQPPAEGEQPETDEAAPEPPAPDSE